ncbi:hypothetical protein MWU52_04840 [Jannaschia sp. S6380]|nr:hypothetical protein [Jannaschia sp. S6380]MCK0166872.1 hypothetical protein [Jannaschia sp. S6380]
MPNLATFLPALCLIALVAGDVLLYDAALLTFLGRQLITLTEYLAFWR